MNDAECAGTRSGESEFDWMGMVRRLAQLVGSTPRCTLIHSIRHGHKGIQIHALRNEAMIHSCMLDSLNRRGGAT